MWKKEYLDIKFPFNKKNRFRKKDILINGSNLLYKGDITVVIYTQQPSLGNTHPDISSLNTVHKYVQKNILSFFEKMEKYAL